MEITKQEKVILSSLKSEWKYIARDENGDLCLFKKKPEKYEFMWKALGKDDIYYCDFSCYNHLFQFIKWIDDNPYSINILINYY